MLALGGFLVVVVGHRHVRRSWFERYCLSSDATAPAAFEYDGVSFRDL